MMEGSSLWPRLLRVAFRLLYFRFARIYDAVAWMVSFGQWKAWGETALPHLAGERILELGHGPGHLIVTLAEQGFFAVGLDLSQQMSKLALLRLRRAGLPSLIIRGRAQTLPFPSHSFDRVVATFPTAYIVDPATLAEVERVLNANGRVVVVLGAELTGADPLSRFIEWLYRATGQREAESALFWEEAFLAAGLTAHQDQIKMRRSEVYLLIAERSIPDDKGVRNDG